MKRGTDRTTPERGLLEALDRLGLAYLRCDAEGRVLALTSAAAALLGRDSMEAARGLLLPALLADPGEWDRLKAGSAHPHAAAWNSRGILLKDRTKPSIAVDLRPLSGADGAVLGFEALLVTRDPEAARLGSMEEALERSAQMARFQDRLVNALAHDLKTPPVVILGFSELLLRGRYGSLSPEQEKPLQTIHRNVASLVDMVERVLVFSRLIVSLPGEREPSSLEAIWAEALERLGEEEGPLAGRFHLENGGADDGVSCNPEALSFALSNLARNALCIMEEDSSAVCRTAPRDGALDFQVDMAHPRPDLPALPRLLDGLFSDRVSPAGGAARGLGLAPGRYVASAMGGGLAAEALPGGGARLILTVPRR